MKKWLRRLAIGALIGLLLFAGLTFLRRQLARQQINQEKHAVSSALPVDIGETNTLEILPLYENAGLPGLQTGHGVSYLVRTDNSTILFDVGFNLEAASPSPLMQNMNALGISLDDVDTIAISHRHPDHLGGQNWWTKGTFSLDGTTQAPLGNIPVYVPEEMTYPGIVPVLSHEPAVLADGIATTGVIPYLQPFPVWLATPKGDEQALAVNVAGRGIILITGCGHMGLESLLARAEAVFEDPVVGIVGGLHYGSATLDSLQPEIALLDGLDPVVVALSPHDSDQVVLDGFAQAFPEAYVPIMVGQPIVVSAVAASPYSGDELAATTD
ncbi:MAG: MBL fold metallo-hydrolase [Anaerolineales bacterium]|nr:MBL fold metallo-hydrolase [Anaerolineales bacterium]